MQHPLDKEYRQETFSPNLPDSGVASTADHPRSWNPTKWLSRVGPSLKQLVQTGPRQLKQFAGNESLSSRALAHLVVILLIVLAIGLSKAGWSWSATVIRPLKRDAAIPAEAPAIEQKAAPLIFSDQLNNFQTDIILPAAVPHTIIPERAREEISTYVVETGDTVFTIAAKFGLTPETITWSNPGLENNPDLLSVGQELTILPVNGVYHQVGDGDTLEGIAGTYQVESAAILNYPFNQLDPDNPVIESGQWLVVPGGVKPFVPRTVVAYIGPAPEGATTGSGAFSWPASGAIYQDYWSGHPALDIADRLGAPVLAADSGYVVAAGWDDTGYGYRVVIDHGNGFQTWYAHLQAYYVEVGDNVTKGQQIAEMGQSGNSTGPHVHFEVRDGTVQRNPYGFLQ